MTMVPGKAGSHIGEFERLSKEVMRTHVSSPRRGFMPTCDGVYFNEALVDRALQAAANALELDPTLDLLRLSRAALLRMIGRLEEADADAGVLIAAKGECAAAARALRRQVRASLGTGR